MSYTLYFDGSSKSNPGLAGAGAVLYDENHNEIWCISKKVGDKETNNYAEYYALVIGLEECLQRKLQGSIQGSLKQLIVKGDSLLVIKQMKGEYKVKSENLLPLYKKAKELQKELEKDSESCVEFIHVYRCENKRADELSNNFYK